MSTIKKIYRTVLPKSLRDSLIIIKLKRQLPHNWIYDSEYYQNEVESPAALSAEEIAKSVHEAFKPVTLIDVGCGTGALLEAFRGKGCEVFGLEYAEAALSYCRKRDLNVEKFDLERDVFDEKRSFDVAVSLEVAEHLPEKVADRYVDLLTGLSKQVLITAAGVGQGGTDHVNEQPPSYWIAKFHERDFEYDEELSECWKREWKATGFVQSWYYENLMLFRHM